MPEKVTSIIEAVGSVGLAKLILGIVCAATLIAIAAIPLTMYAVLIEARTFWVDENKEREKIANSVTSEVQQMNETLRDILDRLEGQQ